MRTPAPAPQSLRLGKIQDGYQLCARCGRVMTAGEACEIVPRSADYLIYSHPYKCSAKAVKGWLAAAGRRCAACT
jgi:hypothetical protein